METLSQAELYTQIILHQVPLNTLSDYFYFKLWDTVIYQVKPAVSRINKSWTPPISASAITLFPLGKRAVRVFSRMYSSTQPDPACARDRHISVFPYSPNLSHGLLSTCLGARHCHLKANRYKTLSPPSHSHFGFLLPTKLLSCNIELSTVHLWLFVF